MFAAEGLLSSVAHGIRAGDIYKNETLVAVDNRIRDYGNSFEPSAASKIVFVRLREAEDAIDANRDDVESKLTALDDAIELALTATPGDSFLWLERFWLDNMRKGLLPEHFEALRASYRLGPHEGWIALKRNRIAMATLAALPEDLRQLAFGEFVDLVRWGFIGQTAAIAAQLDRQTRSALFRRLQDVKLAQRRPFAQEIYRQGLDDVWIPGVDPPPRQVPIPVLPPGY